MKRALRYVRKNFDWDTYLNSHYPTKPVNNGEIRICCPHCGENEYKLYINPDKKMFHCFKCDFTSKRKGHDVFDFVAITENITRGVAIINLLREYQATTPENLQSAFDDEYGRIEQNVTKVRHESLPGLPQGVTPIQEGSTQWNYLIERGLTPHEITNVLRAHQAIENVPIIDSKGKYRTDIGNRVVFPVYGGDHQLISWQARSLGPSKAKYVNAPETGIADTLWPYVPPAPGTHVVLCEGILDCVAVRRAGYAGYATFSKHMSTGQLDVLQVWGVKDLTLFWDLDAHREVKKALKWLNDHMEVYVPGLTGWPEGLDCGACLAKGDGSQFIQQAITNKIKYGTLDYLKWEVTNGSA